MKTIQYELSNGIATLTFDEPDSPVNTMCLQWQSDLTEATDAGTIFTEIKRMKKNFRTLETPTSAPCRFIEPITTF